MIQVQTESPKVGSGEIPKKWYEVTYDERRAFGTATYTEKVQAISPAAARAMFRLHRNVKVTELNNPLQNPDQS